MTGGIAVASRERSPSDDLTELRWVPERWDAARGALEFDQVLDVIGSYAIGERGRAAIASRIPSSDPSWINTELTRVDQALALVRSGAMPDVPPAPDLRGAPARLRVHGSVLELEQLAALRDTAAFGRALSISLATIADRAPELAALREAPIDVRIEAALVRALGPAGEATVALLDSASPALRTARRAVHTARERLIRHLDELLRQADAGAVPGGAAVTVRGGRYVIPVRRDARRRPEGIVHDASASAGTLFIEPVSAIGLGNELVAALAAEEHEVLAVLRQLTERVRPDRAKIAALDAMLVEVDTIAARAQWASAVDGARPALGAIGGAWHLIRARHPLLLARGIDAVPFDLVLDIDEHTLLISGPNTGGKTVMLKATGLVSALVHAGCIPPVAPGSCMPLSHGIIADIGDHQSLADDLSTFAAHVAVLRQVLDVANSGTLVLLDEMGSGTDPAEGAALAESVLEELTARGTTTIATTHLGSLKRLAQRVRGVVNGSLAFDASTLAPTYRFAKGVPGRSYGLAIARRLGVDQWVVDRATLRVPAGDRHLDELLASVEARRQALEREAAELRDRLVDLDSREARMDIIAREQAERERMLQQGERDAARDRARQTKAYLIAAREHVEAALRAASAVRSADEAREIRRSLEQAIRAESDRLIAPRPSPVGDPPPFASPPPLHLGETVTWHEGSRGALLELRPDGKAVVQAGAMRLVVDAASLTPGPADPAAPRQHRPVLNGFETPTAASEVDLRGLRADEASTRVQSAIDQAVLAELPTLAIIHGMGTGVLRELVRRELSGDPRVDGFELAPRQQGGAGVTIAMLRR